MKKAFKIIGIVLAVLIIAVLLVAIIVPKSIKKEETKFTSETIYPQTEIYNIVMHHFENENGKKKKALILGFDGTRRDQTDVMMANHGLCKYLVDNGGGIYKNFAGGVEGNLQPTVTACGWTSILTGTWMDQHSVEGNTKLKSPQVRTFITKLAEDYGKKTALYGTHPDLILDTMKEESEYIEDHKLTAKIQLCPKKNEIFVDTQLLKQMKAELENVDDNSLDLMFGIFDGTDVFGHSPFGGFTEDRGAYALSIKQVDKWGMDLLEILQSRETYAEEDWLIMIVSDHGGLVRDHWGQSDDERDTYFVTNKPLEVQ